MYQRIKKHFFWVILLISVGIIFSPFLLEGLDGGMLENFSRKTVPEAPVFPDKEKLVVKPEGLS